VGATSQPLGFPAPLARLRSPASNSVTETLQRDRPCTLAVYPRLLRDSSLVQTAFAPSPASKYRSASYSSRMPVQSYAVEPVPRL